MFETIVSIEHRDDVPVYDKEYSAESISSIREMLEKAINNLGGLARFVGSGDTVFIKPNVVVPEPPWTAVNTDPRVLETLIGILQDAGPRKIIVGEHVRWHGPRVFRVAEIDKAVKRAGGELVILDDQEHVKVDIPGGECEKTANLPKVYLDCDLLINVPKLKTHLDTLVTVCLKNLMGMVPSDPDCLDMHRHLPQSITDLYRLLKPGLNIVDGIIAHEGQGPLYGTPVPDMGVILAGDDGVAVDAVACEVMGIHPLEVTTTRLAVLEGLGAGNLADIELRGTEIEEVKRNFLTPMINAIGYMRYDGINYPIKMYVGETCPGCHGAIREQVDQLSLLAHFDNIPAENRKDLVIIVGKNAMVPDELPEDSFVWIMGDCASEHKGKGCYEGGCPPPPSSNLGPGCIGMDLTWPVLGKDKSL